jgi:N-acyl-D-amino-acid deacylase
MLSFLIRGATIYDGSGADPFQGDVAIAGDRIIAVNERIDSPAETVLEGAGLALAPGFIDIHSHSDSTLFLYPDCESKLLQGVTTEVTGNCGLGLFPVRIGGEEELADYLAMHDFHLPEAGITWHALGGYATAMENAGLGVNVAPLVGHAPLRIAVLGTEQRQPTEGELEKMQLLLAEAMAQGGWGLSTGLIYPPGSVAATSELIALSKRVAACNGLYASHIRDEGDGVYTALEEAITIGKESGVRVQVSHLKALGKRNHGMAKELLCTLSDARNKGVNIAADQYPYAASATSLTAVVPQWAHDGGRNALLQRLQESALQERLEKEIDSAIAAREGADGIMIGHCRSSGNRHLSGKSLAAVATSKGCTPAQAVLRLLIEEKGEVGAIFFSMAEEDVVTIMADPLVAVGSDGHGLNAVAAAGEATHPRSYGTFPRVLGCYVREKGLLSLAHAINKMTGLPASRLGMADRGIIRPGAAADLLLFDPATIIDKAGYGDPHRYSKGVEHLLVNGKMVVKDGKLTGERPGRVLKRGAAQ